jgi:hypothetical protein
MSKKAPDIPPGTPDCLCCHDSGIVDHSDGYRWCLCAVGQANKAREEFNKAVGHTSRLTRQRPQTSVEEANYIRAKLGLK